MLNIPRLPVGNEGGDERWLITYADMITLLLVLFIILYATANTDLKKFEALAKSLADGFGAASPSVGIESESGGSELGSHPVWDSSGGGVSPIQMFPELQTPVGIFSFVEALEGAGGQGEPDLMGQLAEILEGAGAAPDVGRGLDPGTIQGIVDMLSEKLAGLGAEELAGMTAEELAGLIGEDIGGMTAEELAGMIKSITEGLSAAEMAAMGAEDLAGLVGQLLAGLGEQPDPGQGGREQSGAVGQGIVEMLMDRLGGLGADELAGMSEEELAGLIGEAIGGLTAAELAGLVKEALEGKSVEELAAMGEYELAGLIGKLLAGLGEQVDPGAGGPSQAGSAADTIGVLEDLGAGIEVEYNERGIRITVYPGEILFESGSARLKPEFKAVLNELQPFMESIGNRIEIQGHTDNVPINTLAYPSNWELSAGRASAVVRYLINRGLPANRLQAAGYADTMPVESNTTRQGRARNRRVDILVLRDDEAAWNEFIESRGSPGAGANSP